MITDVGGMETEVEGGEEGQQRVRGGAAAMTNVVGEVPLREMVGYSTDLRSLTSGEANFTMSLVGYKEVLSQNIVSDIREEREADVVANGGQLERRREEGGDKGEGEKEKESSFYHVVVLFF